MGKKIIILMLILGITMSVMGCGSEEKVDEGIDFSVSYLDIQDNKLLVENNTSIRVKAPQAKKVELNIQEYGEEKIETIIEEETNSGEWDFVYSNNDPFIKEIWVVAYYENKEIESQRKVITNQIQTYENAFENIIPISTEEESVVTLKKEKINISVLGWLDEESILGQDNNQLITYNFSKDEKNVIHDNIWNIFPRHDMKKIAYQDDGGFYVSSINLENKKKIYEPQENEIIKDLTWSTNNKEIILHVMQEEKDLFYLINTETGSKKIINAINKGKYAIENLITFSNGYVYVLGNQIVEDEIIQETGVITELLRINIYSGSVKSYTPNLQTIDQVEVLSQVNSNEFLIRVTTKTISEEDMSSENNIYILNTQNKTMKIIKKDIDFPYVYHVSPEKNAYIYLKKAQEGLSGSINQRIIVLGEDKGKEVEILKAMEYYPKDFYWSPNRSKILFYLDNTKELYLISKKASENH